MDSGGGSIAPTVVQLEGNPLENIVSVTTGHHHSCALDVMGNVTCWGANQYGQVGIGTMTAADQPPTSTGMTNAVAIAAGRHHTCAIDDVGAVYCWGDGFQGQLGGTDYERHSSPTIIAYTERPAVSIAAGDLFSCATFDDGSTRCWGANENYQLGNGSTSTSVTPVVVSGISDASSVAAGGVQACVTNDAGNVFCWGRNSFGALASQPNLYHAPTLVTP